MTSLIAVASAKGGVGKSTIAVAIALALQRLGHRVGLLDADIHGPSIPQLLNIDDRFQLGLDPLLPISKYGLKVMSLGLLVDAKEATVWRGPMLVKVLDQLLLGTSWGELDYMVIDTPPGTGDIHLSLAKRGIDGAIMVTTPQALACAQTQKSINMLQKLNVPILGLVENMSFLLDTGKRHYIFGQGGAERLASSCNLRFLGVIPLLPSLSEAIDMGLQIESLEIYLNHVLDELLQ